MQAHTAQLAAVVRGTHRGVAQVDLINDGKVTRELLVHGGSVSADRTAAQMRSMDVEFVDPTGTLTYEDLVFGPRLQLWRGARIGGVDTRVSFHNTEESWRVSTGVTCGVKVDSSGALTLGP